MEDAATAEISRTQIWQWLHHSEGVLSDGRNINSDLIKKIMKAEIEQIKHTFGKNKFEEGKYEQAIHLFEKIILKDTLDEFLTLSAYDFLD